MPSDPDHDQTPIDDRGIWKLALAMVAAHDGFDVAAFQVATHADEALDRGDLDQGRIWRRVLKALRQLDPECLAAGTSPH